MHIYAFGSVCRGDIDKNSDVDLLAVVNGHDDRFDSFTYSVYSYERLRALWSEGNPFAWHLCLESRLIFASDDQNFLQSLGQPNHYQNGLIDCQKFYDVFRQAIASYQSSPRTRVFDLSTIFLSIRNFATCYSLAFSEEPTFSRNSAREIGKRSIPLSYEIYDILKRARILCTRATGDIITKTEMCQTEKAFAEIDCWMSNILRDLG